MASDNKIPRGRVRRSAKLGTALGVQATRYAGTKTANVARSRESAEERLEGRHLETAIRIASTLGEMKGAAMKLGQLASFVDTDFLPDEYREVYQEQLARLRTSAPAMPWDKVNAVLEAEYRDERVDELFADIEPEAVAAASIGQVHRATLHDGRTVALKVQYPGVAEALESDLQNMGMIVRLGKALAPGLDPKAIAAEIRERVMEELDYEYEAQNQRSFSHAYRGHPFIYVPDVLTRLSRRRVLVTEYVAGMGFEEVKRLEKPQRDRFGEIVFRFSFGSIYHLQHFNADRDPGALRAALHDLGFVKNPSKLDCERLLEHVLVVGGWYLEDREVEISPQRVMKVIESTSDPRSEYFDLMRRESVPAEELMGRRMETGVLAVLGQLRARRNWYRIMREWVYADPPATELGELEWDYFESRGVARTTGLAS